MSSCQENVIFVELDAKIMETLSVGEFKSRFSEVLSIVEEGGEVQVTYGKSKKVVGRFVPPVEEKKEKRKLGIWKDECEITWVGDGKVTEEEFLGIE